LIRELKLNMHASAAAFWRVPIGFTKAKRRPVGRIPHHMSRSAYCSLQEFPGPVTFRDCFCHAESHYAQKRVKNACENLP
jgi:hypothetical protein